MSNISSASPTATTLSSGAARCGAAPRSSLSQSPICSIGIWGFDRSCHSGAREARTRNLEIPRCAIAHLRSGADAPSRNDAQISKHLEIFALFPVRHFGLEALDFGVLDMNVVVDKSRAQRLAKERIVF